MTQKYFIKTYGCQMNVHESEKLAGVFVKNGFINTDNIKDADAIIFNTCCIRDGVEQKIQANIGALKNIKKNKPNCIIAVCGCMTQASGRSEKLLKMFPFIDIIFGTYNLYLFEDYLLSKLNNNKKTVEIWEKNENFICENEDVKRDNINNNAWVNITYGCNNFCTYCIVPFVRGRERSRNIDDIIVECKNLISEGYKYITLLGQNVNSYGNDLNDGSSFNLLLQKLEKLEGDFRIKFMTSHPKDLNEEVIKTIANSNKICNTIHLPVQSGSNNILKLMNRNYTKEHYMELIKTIRKYIPDCYISTDIIVGFPSETEENFEDTIDLIQNVKFDGVFAFMYSKRSGTIAEKMPNQIDLSIKRKRINKLLSISKMITKEKNKNLINNTFEVLLKEKIDSDLYLFISHCGKNIYVQSTQKVQFNKFYKIIITDFKNNKIYGKII